MLSAVSTGAYTLFIRANGAGGNTPITVTVPAGQTTGNDTTHTYNMGDYADLDISCTANGTAVMVYWGLVTSPTPPAVSVYRSIGTTTGTLYNTGNASIDIGTTTVTFGGGASLPVPTAVGAVGQGDKLIIGAETFYILSRVDATHVTVQTAAASTHSSEAYTIARAYNDFQTWENGQQGDLVAGNRIEVGVAYKDGVFAPTLQTLIDGSTTNARNYMDLTVAPGQRHNGTAGTGVIVDGALIVTANNHVFSVSDTYFRMEWLEIRNYAGNGTAVGVPVSVNEDDSGNNLFSNLIIHNYTSNGGTRGAFNVYEDATIRNCIIYKGDVGIRAYSSSATPFPTLTLQNNTIYSMTGIGVHDQRGTLIVNNTISVGCTTRDFDVDNAPDGVLGPGSGYNMYNTADAPPGTNNQTPPANLDDLFVSIGAGSENLHLEPSGHNALNNGIDLSASFTDDIDGQTRPTGAGTWDIGADEVTGDGQPSYARPHDLGFCAGQ